MKTACHYAIIRFMPLVETGEFANIGIVVFAPTARYFSFKLLGNRYARVTNFFDQLDSNIFRISLRTFREEMDRVTSVFKPLGTDKRLKGLNREAAINVWTEVIKPRETVLRFSDDRIVMADDPAKKLRELYDYYVERSFVTREYKEQILDRAVRGWLRAANLQDKFHPAKIGNNEYSAQFPFVEFGNDELPLRAIKPLNLDYDDASRIIDHGGQWIVRVTALKKRDLLPKSVLFTVSGPSDLSVRGKAKSEIVKELKDVGVIVVPHSEADLMHNFSE